MSEPILKGTLKTNVSDMVVGDYIAARYTTTATTAVGSFSEIGTVDTNTVNPWTTSNLDGYVYLIKIDRGTLMCNMITMVGIPYKTINNSDLACGKKITIDTIDYIQRIPCANELDIANSTIADGVQDMADALTNFNTTSTAKEKVQELDSTMKCGVYTWNNGMVTYEAITTNHNARFVLTYKDNDKSIDVFH